MVSVNLIANTDLRTAEEFRQLVVKQDKGRRRRLERSPSGVGAENLRAGRQFNGETATFMGHLGAADGQLPRCESDVCAPPFPIQASCPWV